MPDWKSKYLKYKLKYENLKQNGCMHWVQGHTHGKPNKSVFDLNTNTNNTEREKMGDDIKYKIEKQFKLLHTVYLTGDDVYFFRDENSMGNPPENIIDNAFIKKNYSGTADVIYSAIRITTDNPYADSMSLSEDLKDIFQTMRNLPNCEELDCSENQLTQLPDLPNCVNLDCSYNLLTQLPELPKCVKLYCFNNKITQLPDLPNCEELDSSENQLTQLPALPSCVTLICFDNQLTQLPDLPSCVELICSDNKITQLPHLPVIYYLKCINNPVCNEIEQICKALKE